MPFLDKLAARLSNLIDSVLHVVDRVECNRKDPHHLYCRALLCSNIRLTEGIRDSLCRKDEISACILVRSLMESFADLKILSRDKEYIKSMLAALRKEQKKMLEAVIRNPENPIFFDFKSSPCKALDRVKKDLSDFRRDGIKPLTVKEKFIEAKMHDEYEGAYALVCMHAHNNVATLEDRHFRVKNGQLGVYAFPGLSDDGAQKIAGKAAPFLVDSVAAFTSLVTGNEPTDLEPVRHALQELRKLWTPEATSL